MRFVLFYHSIASCWNHGNAHFLRGVVRELLARGHQVIIYEPHDGWSRLNALQEGGGSASLQEAEALLPGVIVRPYDARTLDLEDAVDGADVVIAHEWNSSDVISGLSRLGLAGGRFTLLFHDTHHRGVTAPGEIDAFDLEGFDAVLAFGEVLREIYERKGWSRRTFVWQEAADVTLFKPSSDSEPELDLIWIGNWGDGERERELEEFLVGPIERLSLKARIHGVRYPQAVRDRLIRAGIDYAGWLPNHRVPQAFALARVTAHVPRRPYVEALPGIPTIRVFEELACGIPLVSAPWADTERLFPAGSFLMANTGAAMTAALQDVLNDAALARSLSETGRQAILARHTCAHRVDELLSIIDGVRVNVPGASLPREGALA
jgi:spore maturation protein CgeB